MKLSLNNTKEILRIRKATKNRSENEDEDDED